DELQRYARRGHRSDLEIARQLKDNAAHTFDRWHDLHRDFGSQIAGRHQARNDAVVGKRYWIDRARRVARGEARPDVVEACGIGARLADGDLLALHWIEGHVEVTE